MSQGGGFGGGGGGGGDSFLLGPQATAVGWMLSWVPASLAVYNGSHQLCVTVERLTLAAALPQEVLSV